MVAGAVIGVVTVVAIAVDYSPSLTPEMIKLLFYKGLGAAAVGTMIVGTWIARGGREKIRQAEESNVVKPVSPDPRVDDLALQEGATGLLSDNAASYREKAETPEHLNAPEGRLITLPKSGGNKSWEFKRVFRPPCSHADAAGCVWG